MNWYLSHCDGDWEHQCGPEIRTLDNPGWRLKIPLEGTERDGHEFPRLEHNYDHGTGWFPCWTEDNEFHGAGGPLQLAAMIEVLRSWVADIR